MWTQPKTDWIEGSKINATDFNRIKNNMLYLIELAFELVPEFMIEPLCTDKTTSDFPYAREWNAIERDIDQVYGNTYAFAGRESSKTYYPNGQYLSLADLNRIERTQLKIYEYLQAQKKGRKHLPFTLGGEPLC